MSREPRDDRHFHAERSWARMFADAMRGVRVAVGEEANFVIHFAVAAAAIGAGVWVDLSLERWCLIALCVAIVLAAEMANTAIEHLARAVTREPNPEVRDALDVASAAVLMAALGAAVVGAMLLARPAIEKFT
jgi:diacylglycerol kinase